MFWRFCARKVWLCITGLIGDFANKRKQVLVKTYNKENIKSSGNVFGSGSSRGTGLFGGGGGQSSGSVLGAGSSSSSGSGILLRWTIFFYTNQNQQQSSSLFGGSSNNQNKSIFWGQQLNLLQFLDQPQILHQEEYLEDPIPLLQE